MISYANESLFYKDNVEKQLNISFTGGSITNTNIRAEELEIDEDLCTGNELNFGECNANKISFVVGYYEKSIAGKTITVTITPSGGTAFQLGVYKVLSDYPTADRHWRKIVAYDALYDVLRADVRAWYDATLPNANTTLTLKQFRDSFFAYFGITQKSATLPNDTMTVTRNIEPSCITGKTVLNKILEINGCFGKIGRDGKFKYITLEKPTSGLFPATTLYPSTSLYPQKRGFVREENQRIYNALEYEEYEVRAIDCLRTLDSEGNVQATIGSGSNVYLVKDNFLLFGKSNADVATIASNMFANISERFYRPCKIDTIGNPCLEVGDGINLRTIDGVLINTYILRRKLKGIQSLKDTYTNDGLEYRSNDRNGLSDQIITVKDNIRKIEADYVKTTYLEANYVTTTYLTTNYLTAGEISADYASIQSLNAVDAKFNSLNADNITAGTVSVSHLDVNGIVNSMAAKNLTVQAFTATGVATLGGKMCYWQDDGNGYVLHGSSE